MENMPISMPAEKAVGEWTANLRGRVIRNSDPDYDRARRVYNAMIDRKPWCITQCADVADVIYCVNFAREHKVQFAIRGGGHSVPGFGTCDQGVVIDLSGMKGIRVDESKRLVRVEGGCTWGDVDHATHVFGLATPGGIISTTGVGGLATGGGFGHLTRRYGLVCDNLVSAEIVTADGKLRKASATENPDLFWAIRGGSGNFGVVTCFEFRLHPVSQIYAGPVLYPIEEAGQVLRCYRDFMRIAPRELSAFFAFLIVPPGPPFPEALHGKTVCGIVVAYCGNLSQGETATKQLKEFGSPLFSHVGPVPYPVFQSAFDALLPPGLYHYWKADFMNDLAEEAIAEHVKYGPQVPTVNSAVHIYPLDGAVHDVGVDQTAFAYRDVRFVHILAAVSPEPEPMDGYRNWIREYYDALHPLSAGGSYVNFLMDEGEDRIASSYRGNYARLAGIKMKYDPGNLFCTNQNIKPVPVR
jgi:FAD/FMN-containing dehydrogenase